MEAVGLFLLTPASHDMNVVESSMYVADRSLHAPQTFPSSKRSEHQAPDLARAPHPGSSRQGSPKGASPSVHVTHTQSVSATQ